jgi:hypothetical protein
MTRKNAAGALCALLVTILVATTATAQNTVPRFSHGPTYPVFEVSWNDSTGDTSTSLLDTGAGYALRFNFLRNWDERWSGLTVAVPFYVSLPEAGDFRYRMGIQLETLNGLIGFGGVVDMVNTMNDTGALVGEFSKANVGLVFSFGLNFGGGNQPTAAVAARKPAGDAVAGAGTTRVVDHRPPPGYVGW